MFHVFYFATGAESIKKLSQTHHRYIQLTLFFLA